MIASAKELGLGEEHNGILRLVELGIDAPVGTDAIALLGLDDVAVEINVTPDRGYALSIRGVAREYSHATGATFRDPGAAAVRTRSQLGHAASPSPSTTSPRSAAASAHPSSSPASCATSTRRKPTPAWMIARLTLAGIRSLGILIDITNYVMLELGQPDPRLRPRQAQRRHHRAPRARGREARDPRRQGARRSHAEDLLITDESGPIGLAGVMGGGTTEMGRATRNVLIEAATFDPVSIARTARRHKLPSEASRRFERGVDPLDPVRRRAARRRPDGRVRRRHDRRRVTAARCSPSCRVAGHRRCPSASSQGLIGVDYTRDRGRSARSADRLRASDERADELARHRRRRGAPTSPTSGRSPRRSPASRATTASRRCCRRRRRAAASPPRSRAAVASRNALAAAGYVETPSFPFTTEEQNDLHGSASGGHLPSVKLANPLDGQAPFLRRSLVPGLLRVAHRNVARGLHRSRAVRDRHRLPARARRARTARAFVPPLAVRPDAATLAALDASIPPQHRHVAVLLTGIDRAEAARRGRRGRRTRRRARRGPHDRLRRRRHGRGRAGRARRAAPGSHRRARRWARPRSATSASCCPPWPRPPTFPVA